MKEIRTCNKYSTNKERGENRCKESARLINGEGISYELIRRINEKRNATNESEKLDGPCTAEQ